MPVYKVAMFDFRADLRLKNSVVFQLSNAHRNETWVSSRLVLQASEPHTIASYKIRWVVVEANVRASRMPCLAAQRSSHLTILYARSSP